MEEIAYNAVSFTWDVSEQAKVTEPKRSTEIVLLKSKQEIIDLQVKLVSVYSLALAFSLIRAVSNLFFLFVSTKLVATCGKDCSMKPQAFVLRTLQLERLSVCTVMVC